jgi:hypothetical protein
MLLRRGTAWRALVPLAVPATVITAWTFATRPHLAFNPGDGGWWLADFAAVRFGAAARQIIPSFLRPVPATWLLPCGMVALVAALVAVGHRRPALARAAARASVAATLLAGAVFVGVLHWRQDGTVELEDPQIVKLGGVLEPPIGTFSRYGFPNGWRIAAGEGVEVPLNLGTVASVEVEGWLDGAAQQGAALHASWNGNPAGVVLLNGVGRGRVALPPPPSGRVELRLVAAAPAGGSVVLDRLRIAR